MWPRPLPRGIVASALAAAGAGWAPGGSGSTGDEVRRRGTDVAKVAFLAFWAAAAAVLWFLISRALR
jgi:hypothetical protein